MSEASADATAADEKQPEGLHMQPESGSMCAHEAALLREGMRARSRSWDALLHSSGRARPLASRSLSPSNQQQLLVLR